MLLLTGPAGSGKTHFVLEQFRGALARNEAGVRLLVPTATMAQHTRNRIAREGFVLRPSLVETLSGFIDQWAELPQVSEAHFYLIVEAAVRRVNRPEFARVAHMPGFCASLARTLEEFSSAGCDSRRLAHRLPDTPLGEASLAVFEEVDRELERRGVATRAARLERVAARIHEDGMPGISAVWLDGFHALPDPELAVIEAMARYTDLTLTLPAGEAAAEIRMRLLAMGFAEQVLDRKRAQPVVEVVEAASIEREADEIARRIIEEAAGGRQFREMGIIVRNAKAYEPILRAVCERFGIPARFYLDAQLSEHGVTRFLAGIVDALLDGWEHGATLAVLRMEPALGNSNAMDQFDFEVRRRLPGRGLAPLEELAEDAGIAALIENLETLEEWRDGSLLPTEWAERLQSLISLYPRPRPSERASREMVLVWRSQAAALASFGEAMGEAAGWFGASRSITLAEFWRAAKAILRLTALRVDDERRNVVHVLSAPEARQWELPVIFVCGLVEKQFPRYSPQNAFFPDAARRQLQAAGVRLRTSADAEIDEESLFHAARTRATAKLVLSYPKFDERGEQNLPSLFLEGFPEATAAQPVVPRIQQAPAGNIAAGTIAAADLRDVVARRHRVMRVTAVESYVQCPFQFFARYTLALEEPPARPEERLDTRVQGNIVHQVVGEWLRSPQPIEPLFERCFAETCRKERIPVCHRTEALRAQMRDDLARFARHPRSPAGVGTRVEESFQFELTDSVALRGRIDRLELLPDGAADVIDYKYSKQASDYAKNVNRLQGPLYLLAVRKAFEQEPGTVSYCGLRGAVQYVIAPVTAERLQGAIETTLRVAAEVREGNVAPHPADPGPCRYCTFKDICRYRASAAERGMAEGA